MQGLDVIKGAPVRGEDVARWLVFSSFWGSIYYLEACVSLIAASRRRPVEIDSPTIGTAYGLHLLTFLTSGSLGSALVSQVRGKPTSQQAEEAIGSGQLERSWPIQGLGGAVGSLVPLALAVASQRIARRFTGGQTLSDDVTWPVAAGTMVALSGLTALAVGRIAAWVAEDAKAGQP